jgi:hypothetical protein
MRFGMTDRRVLGLKAPFCFGGRGLFSFLNAEGQCVRDAYCPCQLNKNHYIINNSIYL